MRVVLIGETIPIRHNTFDVYVRYFLMVNLHTLSQKCFNKQYMRNGLACAITFSIFMLLSPGLNADATMNENNQVYMGAIFTGGPIRPSPSVAKPASTPTKTATPVPTQVANATSTPVTANPTVGIPSGDPCESVNQSSQQRAMIKLLTTKPPQARTVLRCNPILMEQAMRKAKDMIERKYYGHVDIDGFGMNYFLRKAGYPLPSYYLTSKEANNVEALAAGPDFGLADAAFQGYLNSSKHRPQVLGLTAGWAAQDEYGVGYAYSDNSKYANYWVVITAKNGD